MWAPVTHGLLLTHGAHTITLGISKRLLTFMHRSQCKEIHASHASHLSGHPDQTLSGSWHLKNAELGACQWTGKVSCHSMHTMLYAHKVFRIWNIAFTILCLVLRIEVSQQ